MWYRVLSILLLSSCFVLGANVMFFKSNDSFTPSLDGEPEYRWKVFDSLLQINQPNAARNQLDAILEDGIKSENHYDISKAVGSYIKTVAPLEPDERKGLFVRLDSTARTLTQPAKSLSQLTLTDQMLHLHRLWFAYGVDVEPIVFGKDTLVMTDDYQRIQYVLNQMKTIEFSLRELDEISFEPFISMLNDQDRAKKFFPTVFDYSIAKLISYYKNYEVRRYHDWKVSGTPENSWFSTPPEFLEVQFDEPSLHHKVLSLYQRWGFHHQGSLELGSQVYYDRLKYIFEEENVENPKKKWQRAFDYYVDNEVRSKFLYEKARLIYDEGKQYHFKTNPEPKDKLVEAQHLLKKELKQFPASDFKDQIEQLISIIEQPKVGFNMQNIAYPGDKIPLKFMHQNIDKVTFLIFDVPENIPENKGMRSLLKDGDYKKIRTHEYELADKKDFQERTTEYLVDPINEAGEYYMIAVSSEEAFQNGLKSDSSWRVLPKTTHSLTISEIMVNSERQDDGLSFLVTNYKTGEPIENAKVNVYYNRRFDIGLPNRSGQTDDKGKYFAKISDESVYFEVIYNGSKISSSEYVYNYNRDERDYTVKILTDRAIYRPGQTVHYKLITYEGDENKFNVCPDKDLSLTIRNSSYSVVNQDQLVTNEYGSASGSFTLPLGGPFGNFSMSVSVNGSDSYNNSHNFKVEEYKRPTFKTEIKLPTSEAKLNDSVKVKGEALAFAGYPITGAKVNYKIYRNWNTYWRYFGGNSQGRDLVLDSTMKTNENGEYLIEFFAKTDPNAPEHAYYNFEIVADVIDISGETHEAQTSLSLSKTGLRLNFSGASELIADEKSLGVYSVVNMAGKKQKDYSGTIEIYSVKKKEKFLNRIWSDAEFQQFKTENWKELFPYAKTSVYGEDKDQEKLIRSVSFEVGDSLQLNELIDAKQGQYVLKAYVITKAGDTLRNNHPLTSIDLKANDLPKNNVLWTYQNESSVEVGEKVQFQVGSSVKGAQALVQLRRGKTILKEEWVDVSKRKSYDYVAKEKDRGGVSFSAVIIYDGKRYNQTNYVNVPFSNKKLNIKAETFRDKLLPGQKEEWRFTISGENADQLAAEVCAGMYDASLDQFAQNYWGLWPYRGNYYYNSMKSAVSRYTQTNNGIAGWADRSYSLRNYYQSPLRISNYERNVARFGYYRHAEDRAVRSMSVASGAVAQSEEAEVMANGQYSTDEDQSAVAKDKRAEPSAERSRKAEDQTTNKPVQIRENFNETAFFYPDLRTNEKGEFVVSFTLPESLTEWKFMALAHTKDMKTGQLDLRTVAQKPLMVTSNAPRFFRKGDRFNFASKVVNLTEEEQEVEVTLSFFDPTNDEVIQLIGRQPKSKRVKVAAGQSKEVVWNLNLDGKEGLIAYKITAANQEFSDGEQKALPVLTNRQLITESMPFVLPDGGTTKLTFEPLLNNNSKSLEHERYVLEYTSNPSWNAVLALPYLAEYPYECAEQVFSRYYANRIAATVVENKPKIKAMFEEWRNYSPEVFMSELQKNEELKTILLEETPWILDAKGESERKRRIAELFEVNQLARSQEKALYLLSKKQNSDGGFGWFGGNRSNVYITQHIVAGFGHLKRMNIEVPQQADEMVEEALKFLDDHYLKNYRRLTEKQKKSAGISGSVLHWMYASSYFDHNQSGSLEEVVEYHQDKLRDHWSTLGLQQHALAGMYFSRIDDEKYKDQILASLRDRSKSIADKGMYFPENNGGYYWSDAKIETHALITEFFAEVKAPQSEVDALRLWLILQKRSNAWENTKATALATYALLMKGSDYLSDQSEPSIRVGETKLVYNTEAGEGERNVKLTPGLGYLKTTWTGKEVTKDLASVEVSKSTNTPSYGAIYWKYFEDMSKVESSSNEDIQVERTYRKVVAGPKGDEYIEQSQFAVGDRVSIQLVVTVENDLEYVHLKDLRPAGFEPLMSTSQHKWNNRLWYYQSPRDVSMNYFIDWMPKGTHVLTYEVYVTSSGQFDAGNATVQCMYAPEFVAHSGGEKVSVKR